METARRSFLALRPPATLLDGTTEHTKAQEAAAAGRFSLFRRYQLDDVGSLARTISDLGRVVTGSTGEAVAATGNRVHFAGRDRRHQQGLPLRRLRAGVRQAGTTEVNVNSVAVVADAVGMVVG